MATGTTGAPDCSASRPMPRLGARRALPVRDRPPSQYMTIAPAAGEDRFGGDERLLVVVAAPDREHAAVVVDPLHRPLEKLRLGHELHLRRMNTATKKWSMNEKWLGARIAGPPAGTLSASIARVRKNSQPVGRQQQPDELVDPVGLARARARVEAVEVLGRARVLVDLRLHRRDLGVGSHALPTRPCSARHARRRYRGRPQAHHRLSPRRKPWRRRGPHHGTVWKVECKVGQEIAEGETVVIIESMKMEMPVEAEDEGKVAEIRCEEGQAV